MSNVSIQKPISVDAGVTVTMSMERFEQLKSVENDKERYATHIKDYDKNLVVANGRITELEGQITKFQDETDESKKAVMVMQETNNELVKEHETTIINIQHATSKYGTLTIDEDSVSFVPFPVAVEEEPKKKSGLFASKKETTLKTAKKK